MRPICIGCSREMRCTQTGALLRLADHIVMAADVYRCPICGVQVASSFAEAVMPYRAGQTLAADLTAERGE